MNDLLTRAVAKVIPEKLAEEKLKSGKKLRVYLGIDPTGSKLHLGHTVPLRKLQAFAAAGHEAIFLVGSFTATIGDPTGQDKMREPLTRKKIEENMRDYQRQAGKILDFSIVKMRYNHEWYDAMHSMDFMKMTSYFTVQQMMQRDMFKERMKWKVICTFCKELSDSPIQFQSVEDRDSTDLEETMITCSHCGRKTPCSKDTVIPPPNPVSSLELLYPILQGYDSVAMDVDCEIGGNDQLFNMLCGRKLQKSYGKREKFVLTTHLIPGLDGRKMSKSYENCVYLDDEPTDMYGKLMSLADDLIPLYMECCTDIPMEEVKAAQNALQSGPSRPRDTNPKDLKMRLAREIVSMYHGAKAGDEAEAEFESIFKEKGTPEDIPELKVKKGSLLVDILVQAGLASSKSEARRLIEQGGVKVNEVVIAQPSEAAKEGIVKVGKRKFVRVRMV